MSSPRTPYYLVDETRLLRNLEVVRDVREASGAKVVLALKCFATWSVFDLMARYLDGTTSSSVNEARLGHEHFAGEVHAYSVAFSRDEVAEVAGFADKVIFNSASQLRAHHDLVAHLTVGVRVNPGVSHSRFDLADPARRFSRLGVVDLAELDEVVPLVSGLMFHFNCENEDVGDVIDAIDRISERHRSALDRMTWVSLGGGISFTAPGYPLDRFADALRAFAERHGVQVYLEPGEAVVTDSAELVTTVLDVVHNEVDVAIVDASLDAHLPESLVYGVLPEVSSPPSGAHRVTIAGRTCLAGDVFGDVALASPLQVGDEVRFGDVAAYTMVKANWFNGVPRPSIVVRRLDGTVDVVREFEYEDYRRSLS